MKQEITAVICHPPSGAPNWQVEKVTISRPLKKHEVSVRMVATGICHSDLALSLISHATSGAGYYPKILGHEGAGIVQEIGAAITTVSVGDPVILSFNYCNRCDLCNEGCHYNCSNFDLLNTAGERGMFETRNGEDAAGKFFGQSSFAAISIVQEMCLINMKAWVKDSSGLKALAPFGCGLMTGAGAVLNSACPRPYNIVLITGTGPVGLGAVMTAKIIGCKEIIVVDRVAERLDIAKQLGATKTLDNSSLNADFAEEIRQLVKNEQISYAFDTTGVVSVISSALKAIGRVGRLLLLGIPRPGTELSLPVSEFFFARKTIETSILGGSTGHVMIPKMLQWWKDGKFPVEKIISFFPAENVSEALEGMKSGRVIKPVLVW